MKINGISEAFKSYSNKKVSEKGNFRTPSLNNVSADKIEISKKYKANNAVGDISSNIAKNVDSYISKEKIEGLKQSVQQGTYFVQTEDIVSSILDRL